MGENSAFIHVLYTCQLLSNFQQRASTAGLMQSSVVLSLQCNYYLYRNVLHVKTVRPAGMQLAVSRDYTAIPYIQLLIDEDADDIL